VKNAIDSIFNPITYTLLSVGLFLAMMLGYRIWTKPKIALSILGVSVLFFLAAAPDPNFWKIISKPDNVPIVGLIFVLGFFTWWALRQAAINDERIERGEPPMEATEANDRVLSWPDLVYSELICSVIFTVILVPYCDKNPKGVGYYTLKERPFAVGTFMFGFLILWIALIIMGTFLRGPNWNFFGLFEYWDVHKLETLSNVNLSEYFWIGQNKALPKNFFIREMPGILLVVGYLAVLPPLLAFTVCKGLYKQIGFMRYNLVMSHLLIMIGMVIKMVLRWVFNLKYLIFIPEHFLNV